MLFLYLVLYGSLEWLGVTKPYDIRHLDLFRVLKQFIFFKASVRNKPNYNPMQYSVEWANVMTGYLKKQLQEIILPSMPRPGLNIKQTFKGVLGESDSRDRWVSKFIYS